MKDQRKTEIRVGVTVLVGLLIFLWILGWAKNFSLADTNDHLQVRFSNVDGLEIGDYVTVNGVRKGVVEDFNVDGESVIAKLSINNDVILKEDASFSVSMLDLMGGKKIDISPGNSSRRLNYSKIYEGKFNADIPEVMSMLGSIQGDLVDVMKDVKISLSSINQYLSDESLKTNFKNSLNNLNNISSKLNIMIDENRSNLNKLTANSVELTQDAKTFIKENRTELSNSIKKLNVVLQKTDTLLASLNQLTGETKESKNNLGKFLYDENVYKNLSESINQLNELTKILVNQLKEDGIKVDAYIF